MKEIDELTPPKQDAGNSPAFRLLMGLRRPIPDLDEAKELARWREEKYRGADKGSAGR